MKGEVNSMTHHHTNAVDSHGTVYQVPGHGGETLQAPEIDPGNALGPMLLLAGMLAVLAGRRKTITA